MIINEKIVIRWHSKNKKHYQAKGYLFTKVGDEFEVKVEDLSNGSSFKVDVLCDYCKENISKITYNEHNKRREQSSIKKRRMCRV